MREDEDDDNEAQYKDEDIDIDISKEVIESPREKQNEKEKDRHFNLAKQYFQLVRETDINEALKVGVGLFEKDVKY